jgi:ABC-type sugar transport system ATPase subunit
LRGVSFDLREGEILGVAGLADSGQERLLKSLIGASRRGVVALYGEILRPRGPAWAWARGIAYVPRERRSEGLLLGQDIAGNVALPHLGRLARLGVFVDRHAERAEARELAERVRLKSTGPRQRVWRLSGGNQQKVLFARAIAGAPKVLLLDEPTRGVDVGAKFDIHALLRELAANGAAVLIASSDHQELLSLCSRIAVMRDGRLHAIQAAGALSEQGLLALCYGERAA